MLRKYSALHEAVAKIWMHNKLQGKEEVTPVIQSAPGYLNTYKISKNGLFRKL